MNERAFLQGFLQGLNSSGGVQKIGNWVAKKIGTYDVYDDPIAMQDYQQAIKLGTPAARQSFIDQYGGLVDTGDLSEKDYFFSPAEGSPEWMQNELARLSLENERLRNQYLPRQYEMDTALSEENLNRARTYNEVYPELLDQQVDQGNLNLETGRFNLEQQQNLAPIQQQMAEEQLNKLSTSNEYLKQTLQQQLTANELQNVGLELQNTVRQMEIDRQRELTPYEIEMVKQNVLQNTLQNNFTKDTYDDRLLSLQLGNEGQRLQNQLTGMKIDAMNAPQVADDTSWTALMQSLGFNMDDYAGRTPDNFPVFESVRGGRIAINPNTGQQIDWTGQEVIGEDFNMAETKVVGTAPDGNLLYVNNNDIVIYQDGTPYTDEQGNQYYARRDPFDEKLIFESFNPDFTGGVPMEESPKVEEPGFFEKLGQWFEENANATGQSAAINDVINEYRRQYPNTSSRELANRLNSQSEEWKARFKEINGVDVNSVINILERMKY